MKHTELNAEKYANLFLKEMKMLKPLNSREVSLMKEAFIRGYNLSSKTIIKWIN